MSDDTLTGAALVEAGALALAEWETPITRIPLTSRIRKRKARAALRAAVAAAGIHDCDYAAELVENEAHEQAKAMLSEGERLCLNVARLLRALAEVVRDE